MPIDPALVAWLALLNWETEETVALSGAVVVRYHPQGRGGPGVDLQGIDEVVRWMRRGPPGRFHYTAEHEQAEHEQAEHEQAEHDAGELDARELDARELADAAQGPSSTAERALTCRFRVSERATGWSNTGDWRLHIAQGKIVSVLHVPDRLPE